MPTTPRTGLRYPATSDSPNGPLQIGNLASDLDGRVFPTPRPYIECYLRRSDATNSINATTTANATYGAGFTDMKVYPVTGQVAGTWDTAYSGRGLACTTPGWYHVEIRLMTNSAVASARYVSVWIAGTETYELGGEAPGEQGYGVAAGTHKVRAPSGVQLLFEVYNGMNSTVDLRKTDGTSGGTGGTPLSVVRVVYDGPI